MISQLEDMKRPIINEAVLLFLQNKGAKIEVFWQVKTLLFQNLHIPKKGNWLWTFLEGRYSQSYVIKSAPWTILLFRILEIFSVENIKRLCVFMFQTCSNSQLLRRVLWINAELTIVLSLKRKNTQPIYIFNKENPQNSVPQNGPRRGLDFIALHQCTERHWLGFVWN